MTGLDLVATRAMRARLHPRAVAGLWLWQTGLALTASWPAASLASAAFGRGPHGDAPLWSDGGHALLDFLWHDAHGLAAVGATAKIALGVAVVGGLLPMAGAMIAIACTTRDRAAAALVRSFTGALRAMPSLLWLLGVVGAAEAGTIAIGVLIGAGARMWTLESLGEVRARRMEIAIALVFVVVASGLAVMHDLARAAASCFRATGWRALVVGARVFGQAPLVLWWSWAWRGLFSLAPILAVAGVATRIGGRGGVELVVLALLHQGVVLSRVALHTSWLARAVRAVSESFETQT